MAVKDYTLGLVFVESKPRGGSDYILLLEKKKPESQKGKYNGIGGGFEKKETPAQCMVREAKEEANIDTTEEQWTFIGTLYKPKKWRVHVAYTYISNPQLADIPNECDEGKFRLAKVDNLPANIMPNLRWMIPLIQKRAQENQKDFMVTYYADEID